MARKKKKTPSWFEVKKHITGFNNGQLLDLIGDLYRLSVNNKEFSHARFSLSEDPLKSYKRIIQDAIHPYLEDNETLDIDRAEDAIKRYSKAIDDVKGEAELMVFFVECGNNFTLSYGDIDDDFYDSVLLMYEKAIQNVTELSPGEQKVFKKRLHEIMDSASGIGWGYYDGLRELYYESFPDDL
ncbi:MAG: hypothetical protein H8E19_03155 [Deltaproteobacteria bacterium]|uniref:Uncharacterized protein n=1 Tax=Candidatus Desulfacyla euxinica TaxID=2841693 RepID=A0A8J6T3N0_9DELT|nr:hypothetical protein [Candidatus Desulfacyla euxinica]MBL7217939.1 hypothetical protein [Desulfobacteraceae bacterium]